MRKTLYWFARLSLKPFLAPWVPLSVQRGWSDILGRSTQRPPGLQRSTQDMGGIPALCLRTANDQSTQVILYLHGGAYILGGAASHGSLAAQLGYAAGAKVYLPDYRLAPEHPFPAALDDALSAYRWLLAQGHEANNIVIAGDSAGGGLALATAVAIRDGNLPQPAALVLISPWLDLSLSGDSIKSHVSRDPILRPSWLRWSAGVYCGEHPAEYPLCSPLFANLAGLPPMLVQVGSEEILLDDSRRLEQRAQAAGVSVQLQVFDGMWHDFQAHVGVLPESGTALAGIGAFLKH
jgi:epsilon-lactone hydrolase